MFDSGVPKRFWPYALMTATWLLNRLPSVVLNWKSPYSVLLNTEPSLSDLHPFGCLAYAANLSPSKTKFDSRSLKAIFIGYASTHKGFMLYDLEHSQVFISRDVKFLHSVFPYKISDRSSSGLNDEIPSPESIITYPALPSSPIISDSTSPHSETTTTPDQVLPTPVVRRGARVRHPPIWMQDYMGDIPSSSTHFAGQLTSLTPPTFPYQVSPCLSSSYTAFLLNVTNLTEPSSYKEASSYAEWTAAMDSELAALESNCTWELTDLPAGKKPIGSKWVYKIKLKSDGSVERFKARLVAKGYTQEYGIDYTEVFSPIAKLVSVRFLIAVATLNNWSLHQVDVNNAFLHGFLHDEIYMSPPQGYSKAKKGQVCRLIKSLYGLKQASREWNAEFCLKLVDYGFAQSPHDHCLFYKGSASTFICLLVYVDDILITSPDDSLITELKHYLDQMFTIKDLGPAKYFLGMEIARGSSGTALNQGKYILDLLDSMGFLGCRAASTPLPQGVTLTATSTDYLDTPDSYRKLVGKLLYLNLTRPDLSHAVQQLSQYVARPCTSHWNAALHVLRYLKGSPSLGLFYPSAGSFDLKAYSDADWGTCPDTRRSLTGFCVYLGPCLVSWKCKKQSTVSVSSAEAEYRSLGATVRELLWLTYLCNDFGISSSQPIPLLCDNLAAIHITKNQVFHERTKHLEMDCHLVRDKFHEGFLVPLHVSTELQLADLFTKVLPGPRFHLLLSKLGLVDLHRVQLAGG